MGYVKFQDLREKEKFLGISGGGVVLDRVQLQIFGLNSKPLDMNDPNTVVLIQIQTQGAISITTIFNLFQDYKTANFKKIFISAARKDYAFIELD